MTIVGVQNISFLFCKEFGDAGLKATCFIFLDNVGFCGFVERLIERGEFRFCFRGVSCKDQFPHDFHRVFIRVFSFDILRAATNRLPERFFR